MFETVQRHMTYVFWWDAKPCSTQHNSQRISQVNVRCFSGFDILLLWETVASLHLSKCYRNVIYFYVVLVLVSSALLAELIV